MADRSGSPAVYAGLSARHGGEVCRYRRENGGFSCLPDSYYGVLYHVGFKSSSPPGVVVMRVVVCKGDYRIRGVNDGRNTVARYAGYRRENGGFMCSSVDIRGTVDHQMRSCRLRRSRVVGLLVPVFPLSRLLISVRC